jgi:hypothetical protein
MARRKRERRNGQGTIVTFRRKGKAIGFAAELTVGWSDEGKRLKVRGHRFKDRTEAEAELIKLRKQHEQGDESRFKVKIAKRLGHQDGANDGTVVRGRLHGSSPS